jgi:3-oxoacyl-[acyl-carrier protein] reductase
VTEKSILVTGASKGIGKAIAERLAADGFAVTVHFGRDQAAAEDVRSAIAAAGGVARVIGFDIADREQARAALAADIAAHGAYWGVVLNAGITRDNVFPGMEDTEWDAVLSTNLDGFYNVLKPLIMPMVRKKSGGRIVTLSSVAGLAGNRGQVNYSASKAGIVGASKALAVELASRAITVNCVAPGVIETQMTRDLPAEEVVKQIPMRRFGKPEEVAALVAFLCSDAAGYITRQVISVNGGML